MADKNTATPVWLEYVNRCRGMNGVCIQYHSTVWTHTLIQVNGKRVSKPLTGTDYVYRMYLLYVFFMQVTNMQALKTPLDSKRFESNF